MANYIGSANEVDHYIGNNLVAAKYIGENKYFDAYSEIEGNLPLAFKARVAHALTDYRIYGTENGAGVQTENLFVEGEYSLDGHYLKSDGSTENNQYWSISEYISVSPNTKYTMYNCAGATPGFCWYDANKNYISGDHFNNRSAVTVTSPATAKYVRLSVCTTTYAYGTKNSDVFKLVIGSAYPSYKIPISLQSGVTENEFPFAEKQTITWGNGVITSDGKGNFSISGEISGRSNTISLTEPYTIPASIESGGEYCFYIGNSKIREGFSIVFYDADNNAIENWLFNSSWRKSTGYINMTGKIIAKIGFLFAGTGSTTVNVNVSPMFSKNVNLTTYIPHRYTSNYDLFIGDSKLGEDEYLDYQEQKVYRKMNETIVANRHLDTNSGLPVAFSGRCCITSPLSVPNDYYSVYYSDTNDKNIHLMYSLFNDTTLVRRRVIENGEYMSSGYTIDCTGGNKLYLGWFDPTQVKSVTPTDVTNIFLTTSADPPVPFPTINAYQGENTLSSEETVGEVTIKGRIREPDPLPEMTGIKAVFEYGGLSGTTWKNKVGSNNFTWTSGNAPTDNGTEYVLSGNTFNKAGQYESSDDYSGAVTMYLLAKFETVRNGYALVVGGLESGYTYGIDIYASNTYGDFATASRDAYDLINPAVPANEYHVIAVTAASSDYRITVYGDGIKQLHTTPRTRLPRNYNGKAALYGMLPSSRSSGNMHVKFVAFGNAKHTEEQIIANSQFIMSKYGIS